MLNAVYTHGSVGLVIFHRYMLQNKPHDVSGCVIAYPIKLNISTRNEVTKIL